MVKDSEGYLEKFKSRIASNYFKPFKLNGVDKSNKKIRVYRYNNKDGYPTSLYVKLKLYSNEELDLIDELFKNLDDGNLKIIKGLIHSKYGKKVI